LYRVTFNEILKYLVWYLWKKFYLLNSILLFRGWGGQQGIYPTEFSPFVVDYVKVWSLDPKNTRPPPTTTTAAPIIWKGNMAIGCK